MKPVRIIEGMGAPWSVCTTPGPTQYLFSGDGNGKIYKFDLDGKAQTGLGHGQSGCLVHELHCESETVLLQGRLHELDRREDHHQRRRHDQQIACAEGRLGGGRSPDAATS